MDNWVSKIRAEGEFQSEGRFTVSSAEAIRKLSKFALATPEKGILRLTQLLIAGGADGLEIYLNRAGVQLRIPNQPTRIADFEDLEQQFNLNSNNFALALLSCLYSGFRSGLLWCGNVRWAFDRDGFQREATSKPLEGCKIELNRNAPANFWSKLEFLVGAACLDHFQLSRALAFSPVPAILDSRAIRKDGRVGRSLVCELILKGPSSLRADGVLPLEVESKNRIRVRPAALKHFGYEEEEEPAGAVSLAHLWLDRDREKKGTITFVRHGIAIAEIETQFRLPLSGMVSASALDTDVSGLKLVKNQKLNALWNYLKAELEELVRELLAGSLPRDVRDALTNVARDDLGVTNQTTTSESATGPGSMGKMLNDHPHVARMSDAYRRSLR